MAPTTKKMTPREWYNKKATQYQEATNIPWSFVSPFNSHPLSSECYETMMRMAYEKAYFGLTNTQEDVEIANAIMILDRL